MSILNRSTWKSKFADFINRVAPFDAQPRIQKSEHQSVVGTDLGDSVIFRDGTVQSITSPAAAFDVDFDDGDRFDIDTSASVTTSFTITLQNLQQNETGVLNITKKSGDTVAFANAIIAPFDSTGGQMGKTALRFFIKKVNSSYVAIVGYSVSGNEVVSFTPGIEFSSTGTITYSSQSGVALQTTLSNGDIKVDFNISIAIISIGASSGVAWVNGLPLEANANFDCHFSKSRQAGGFNITSKTWGRVLNGDTRIILKFASSANDGTQISTSYFALPETLILTGWYIHTP